MTCLDCHAPHARKGETVKMTVQGELPCLDCHAEKRGPFVFDHVTGSGGDCLSCHQPHGSNNPKQLLWARVDQLCLSCHSQTGGPRTLGSQPPSFHDLTLAPLPQLHDLPRRGPRLEPVAAAPEVTAMRGYRRLLGIALASWALPPAVRGSSPRRFRWTSSSVIAWSTCRATRRCTARRSTTVPGFLLRSLDYTSAGPLGRFLDTFHVDGSDIGAGPAGSFASRPASRISSS